MYIDNSSPLIENCTFQDNFTDMYGGGIYIYNSCSRITQCSFINNTAALDGGGIYILDSIKPEILYCNFESNSSTKGGGIYISSDTFSPEISECYLTKNSSYEGGGIYSGADLLLDQTILKANIGAEAGAGIFIMQSSTATVTNCDISNNELHHFYGRGAGIYSEGSAMILNCNILRNKFYSSGQGVGIYCTGAASILNCNISENIGYAGYVEGVGICYDICTPIISNCIISKNITNFGVGGIYIQGRGPMITNCIISENIGSRCGGIYNYWGEPQILHCTFSKNSGGAFHCYENQDPFPITNCIFWGDTPDEIYWESEYYFSDPIVTYSDIQGGWEGEGNFNLDPLFVEPNNYHLSVASPCIDTGIDDSVYIDIDGDSRPLGAGFDVGADEFVPDGPVIFWNPKFFYEVCLKQQNVKSDKLIIKNFGTELLEYEVFPGITNWLLLEGKTKGSLVVGEETYVIINLNYEDLMLGQYDDTLTILSNDPGKQKLTVPVHLVVFSHGVINVPNEFNTIQEAINFSSHYDTIIVAEGTYKGEGNKDIDFLGKKITVMSENGPVSTIIDCEKQGRGFFFHNQENLDSKLQGFTVTNGYMGFAMGESGGAISLNSSSPSITNCYFYNNYAFNYGGAIFGNSNAVFKDCIISGNSSSGAGGVYLSYYKCKMSFNNCIISWNTASDGGGIYCSDAYPLFDSCIIMKNEARYGKGGGIVCFESAPEFVNCLFADNNAHYGGGIYLNPKSFPSFTNCTIANNLATYRGHGFYISSATPLLTNSILWNDVYIASGNLSATYSDIIFPLAGEGNISIDPLFANPQSYNFHLRSDSPCIDSGFPGSVVPSGGGCRIDMGAYEFYKGFNCLPAINRDIISFPLYDQE